VFVAKGAKLGRFSDELVTRGCKELVTRECKELVTRGYKVAI